MLIVVSPAKKLDMTPREDLEQSQPIFLEQAADLAQVAGALSQAQLQKLMGISEKLAQLNQERFANFGRQARSVAAFAFAGDTYQGLEARSLDAEELRWAQAHLRILSGIYGLLRPLDAQPHLMLQTTLGFWPACHNRRCPIGLCEGLRNLKFAAAGCLLP